MTVELVQPCADCGMETVPRDAHGHPLHGKCEYYMVTVPWDEATAKDGARFLCIGWTPRPFVFKPFSKETPGNRREVGK